MHSAATIVKHRADFERELRAFGSAQHADVRVEKIGPNRYKVTSGPWESQHIELGTGRKHAMDRFMAHVSAK